MTGALNYQVAHHLFPTISQNYLPDVRPFFISSFIHLYNSNIFYFQIAPIIVQTCKEFGIKYHVLPNFLSAFNSHIDHLRVMGQDPNATPQKTEGKMKAA